jgi:hypothetical protein
MGKHHDKARKIEVVAFVLGLKIEEMRIKKGEASYRKLLPGDANYFEQYANQMALRKGSIHRQAAKQFGYKSTKTVQRYIQEVDRKGWHHEVMALYERDLAAEIGNAAGGRRFETLETVKQMLGLLSQVG